MPKFKLPYEWLIGWRYSSSTKGAKHNTFISFISMISMLGIALGVATLIIVLSVMNGFQVEVRDRMLSVLSHIEIHALDTNLDWPKVLDTAMKIPNVAAGAPFVSAQAMITHNQIMRGVILRGVLPGLEKNVTNINNNFLYGGLDQLNSGQFNIVLGVELARNLRVAINDRVMIITPQVTTTPAGMLPRMRAFKVVGIFESGHFDFDSSLTLIHFDDAQKLLREQTNGLRLRLIDMHLAPQTTRLLYQTLKEPLSQKISISDWSSQNRNWFTAVQTEKRMMFLILALIITVAAFNLVSTLVMTVTDKRADIAILRTMGAKSSSIMQIFMIQGFIIGSAGTVLGVVLGCAAANYIDIIIAWIEGLVGTKFLPQEVYFISKLPSDLRANDVIRIASLAFGLAIISTIYPSWRAAKQNPAQALRYE